MTRATVPCCASAWSSRSCAEQVTGSSVVASCLCISFFFSSRRRHTRLQGDWSSDVCSSDLAASVRAARPAALRLWIRRPPTASRPRTRRGRVASLACLQAFREIGPYPRRVRRRERAQYAAPLFRDVIGCAGLCPEHIVMEQRAPSRAGSGRERAQVKERVNQAVEPAERADRGSRDAVPPVVDQQVERSEEHTSELQSPCNIVCRLLLEKKATTSHSF